ncbi:MAG TPA: tRNA glutamyl-Q(34) synthetase GluQRS [Rhizobiales bacterium]|nr:tRNA glutamyl-Q(34) synthetase GluQRS [Hyphomicrobiales bacterium]
MSAPVFRFAPSPTGYLHLGHAFSALYTWEAARRAGGTVLLRIEDIDTGRCRDEFIRQIFDDLHWLGLDWPQLVRRQSKHFDDYEAAAQKLKDLGLLYECACTRKQIAAAAGPFPARDPDGSPLYPGTCRGGVKGTQKKLWRLDMQKALKMAPKGLQFVEAGAGPVDIDPAVWGDVALVRKDTPTSYHLSVVVDDAAQGVTHVTRGLDVYPATAIHRLLQHFLDLPVPLYDHHRLILDETGRKLSKSSRDKSLKAMRASGMSASEIRAMLNFSQT